LRPQKFAILKKLYANTQRWIPKPKGILTVPTLYGFKMVINANSGIVQGHSIYYDGTYEAGTLHVLSKCLSKGDVFLDIGSNIGLMALYGSKCVGPGGKVLAFEPEPVIFETLNKNITINQVAHIKTLQMALGSTQGTATIYNSKNNFGAPSLIKTDKQSGHSSNVAIRRLDDVLLEQEIADVRMMKVDVEGWELEVLKGCPNLLSRKDAPIICIEISNLHSTHMGSTKDIYDFIVNINDYKIYRLARSKAIPSKLIKIASSMNLPEHDNLFCFLPAHIKQSNSSIFKSEA
jgi:FkbM family methyltransferase